MFRFEHPEFFWFGILAVVMVGAVLLRKSLQHKDWLKWASKSSYERIATSIKGRSGFTALIILAAAFLCIAAVNPQWGYKTEDVESNTADIYVLLDISTSMLAEDVAPNRMEKAKRFAMNLSTQFKTDRVGLILFAGNAYIQSPLTTDWHAIQLYLSSASPSQAGTQGTAIGEAVQLATQIRNEGEDKRGGGLIIITDGEDHDSDAPTAIQEAVGKGWITYIVGVGTEEGATIPLEIDGKRDLKRDNEGQPVVTKMNRSLMIDLAQQGNGKYFDLTEGKTIISNLEKQLATLERTQLERRSFSEHRSYYQYFVMAAIAMLLLYATLRYKYEVV
ncbi:MAG: VWA domain-containing protein [Bacteroidota bacterium]|nr:VWA domain-containing protein [Bacteroidota bacterium]